MTPEQEKARAKAAYEAANRAWKLIYRLPPEQRGKHFSAVCGLRNKARSKL